MKCGIYQWTNIEDQKSDIGSYRCVYDIETGYIIFRISEFKGQEVLDEHKNMEDILKEVCLTWDDTQQYEYHDLISIKRNRKLNLLLLNDEEGI